MIERLCSREWMDEAPTRRRRRLNDSEKHSSRLASFGLEYESYNATSTKLFSWKPRYLESFLSSFRPSFSYRWNGRLNRYESTTITLVSIVSMEKFGFVWSFVCTTALLWWPTWQSEKATRKHLFTENIVPPFLERYVYFLPIVKKQFAMSLFCNMIYGVFWVGLIKRQ